LAIRGQAYFQKSSTLVKGLALAYVLCACYQFCYGAGACLNPALGLSQSTYMIGLQNEINSNNMYSYCIWIYMTAPMFGGLLAGVFNIFH